MLIFCLAIAVPNLYAGDLEQALSLEHAGKQTEAIAAYQKWLAANPPSAAWDKTLLHAAGLISDPTRAAATIIDGLPKLSTDSARHEAYVKIAELDELLGDWNGAQESFENASLVPGPKDFASLLESARILMQLGQLLKASGQVRSIIAVCQDSGVVAEARVLSAKIDAATGHSDRAAEELTAVLDGAAFSQLSPQGLGELYQISGQLGLTSQQSAILTQLEKRFPKSPERALIAGEATPVPSPAELLGFTPGPYEGPASASGSPAGSAPAPDTEASGSPPSTGPSTQSPQPSNAASAVSPASPRASPTAPISIQIGSYLDATNADYRLKDLENAGFSGEIVKATVSGKTYYKVVIPNVPLPQSQDVLTKLKEKGFEGFLLYD